MSKINANQMFEGTDVFRLYHEKSSEAARKLFQACIAGASATNPSIVVCANWLDCFIVMEPIDDEFSPLLTLLNTTNFLDCWNHFNWKYNPAHDTDLPIQHVMVQKTVQIVPNGHEKMTAFEEWLESEHDVDSIFVAATHWDQALVAYSS